MANDNIGATLGEIAEIPTALALLAVGMSNAQARRVDDDGASVPYTIVPDGYRVEELERLLPTPTRKRGQIELDDEASFVAFVARNKTDATTIYVASRTGSFVAVFDEHDGDGPGWREFRAGLKLRHSVEWQRWADNNARKMTQTDFATFIEDNALDVIEPSGADMIEVSRTLEAKKAVNFASSIRLSNGQTEFTYEETIDGSAAKGKLRVPETFVLAIPVFDGGTRYRVTARLRYRIGERGALSMWFDLERPHKIVEDAIEQTRSKIAAALDGVLVVNGKP